MKKFIRSTDWVTTLIVSIGIGLFLCLLVLIITEPDRVVSKKNYGYVIVGSDTLKLISVKIDGSSTYIAVKKDQNVTLYKPRESDTLAKK